MHEFPFLESLSFRILLLMGFIRSNYVNNNMCMSVAVGVDMVYMTCVIEASKIESHFVVVVVVRNDGKQFVNYEITQMWYN